MVDRDSWDEGLRRREGVGGGMKILEGPRRVLYGHNLGGIVIASNCNIVGDSSESVAVDGSTTYSRNVDLSMSEARVEEHRTGVRNSVSGNDSEGVRGGAGGGGN